MLNLVGRSVVAFRRATTFLIFISCFTFQSEVSAGIKQQTADEYRALGFEQQQKGNLNEALTYYTKAVSLGLENAVLFNDMGVLYEAIDLNARAERYYLQSIETDRQYLAPYINLAYLYQRLGDRDNAAIYFQKRYELGDPADPWAQKAKEELIKIRPDFQRWAASLEAESLNKQLVAKSQREFYERVKLSQEHYYSGEKLFKEKKYKEATKQYDAALELAPRSPNIVEARKAAVLEAAKQHVREQADFAIKR